MVLHIQHNLDLVGGGFMRVTVGIYVSKPLCRGHKVLLDQDLEVYVSF